MERLKEKLFLIKQNQLRMMRDRGFLLDPEEALDRSSFLEALGGGPVPDLTGLNRLYLPDPNAAIERPPTYLFYLLRINVKAKEKELLDEVVAVVAAHSAQTKYFIVITNEQEKLGKRIRERLELDIHLTIIDWNMLRVNLPQHVRNPRVARLLPPEEREQLLKQFRANNLPPMLPSDPLVIYYGARGGDIFYLERRNQVGRILHQSALHHRIVVDLSGAIEPLEEPEEEELAEDFDIEPLEELNPAGVEELIEES